MLAQAQAATTPGTSASLYLDATNKPATVYGFDGMGRGDGVGQISLGLNQGIFSGRLSLGGITQNFGGKPNKIDLDGTYLSAKLGGVLLYAGYLDHWWGPGEISTLQLSNNARPMPQIGIERSSHGGIVPGRSWNWIGPWHGNSFWESLTGRRFSPMPITMPCI